MSSTDTATEPRNPLVARRLGIATRHEAVVFLREDSHISRAEGFTAHTRVRVTNGHHSIIATLYHVTTNILQVLWAEHQSLGARKRPQGSANGFGGRGAGHLQHLRSGTGG